MPLFDFYSNIASKNLTLLMGEVFVLRDRDGENSDVILRGVFDENISSSIDGNVPVQVYQPNVIFRNVETGGFLEDRARWIIIRSSNGVEYRIVDFERDANSTTQYLLEEM